MDKKRIILIVDDSTVTISLLESHLYQTINNIQVLKAKSYKDALKYILQYGSKIDVAVIDLHLPDCKDGAMVDIVESNEIKSIVLSGTLDDDSREKIFGKSFIIGCIAKDGKKSIKSVVTSVDRQLKNSGKKILLIDDSKFQLNIAKKILKKMNLQVVTTQCAKEAYELLLNSQKEFSIVITDYHMPEIDGLELTFKIREHFDKDELAIIIVSSDSKEDAIEEFLKIGANDYINKTNLETEMIARVNSTLDTLDLFDKIKDMANKDFLTGIYNRRYFFENATMIFKKAKRDKENIALAMIDIDKFKKVNDTYGHDVGDTVICDISDILRKSIRQSDLLARFGGEEFCILLNNNISLKNTQKLFSKIKDTVENNIVKLGDKDIKVTISLGVYYGEANDLFFEKVLKAADEALYTSKENGRNKITLTQNF